MRPISRDIAIVICSRGREEHLARLLPDLVDGYLPAFAAGGMTATVFVYAQDYPTPFLAGLADDLAGADVILVPAASPHRCIGEVVDAAFRALHDRCAYRLAMLMDDDSVYRADEEVDRTLCLAARRFLDERHEAYSIRLGRSRELAFRPFVDLDGPIMPFKEKMLWVGRGVVEDVLALPRFAELSIGEDAVIAGVAWLRDPAACFGVEGVATFRHLSYEPENGEGAEIAGGYADLVGFSVAAGDVTTKYDEALLRGVTPYHVMPTLFVDETHPHFAFNGIRGEVAERVRERLRSADQGLDVSAGTDAPVGRPVPHWVR